MKKKTCGKSHNPVWKWIFEKFLATFELVIINAWKISKPLTTLLCMQKQWRTKHVEHFLSSSLKVSTISRFQYNESLSKRNLPQSLFRVFIRKTINFKTSGYSKITVNACVSTIFFFFFFIYFNSASHRSSRTIICKRNIENLRWIWVYYGDWKNWLNCSV